MTSRFVGFFRLIEACGQEGCLVCRCLREDAVRHLEALLYEQVNDPGTRAALRASWGFCNWHAWMLDEVPNPGLGAAIIHEDLMGRVLGRLGRLLTRIDLGKLNRGRFLRLIRRRPRVPLVEARRRKADCMICRGSRPNEEHYLRAILDFTGDPEFDRAFSRSWGMCLPHLLRLIELGTDHPRLEPVLKKVETKWRQLRDELKRFIDKHDYRATEAFTEEEARSWRQAVEMLAGAPGLFGNELRGGRPGVAGPPPPAMIPLDRPPTSATDPETLQFEKQKLELRLKELTDQFNEVSSRAAALHYRLWQVLEDRKVLEMNLSGEQASSLMLERTVEELRREIDLLKPKTPGGAPGRPE